MLVINTHSSVCVCARSDLGLWVLHFDLGQPSQTSDHGKNVKAPTYKQHLREDNIVSLLWAWKRDGPLRINIGNTPGAQEFLHLAVQA